MRVVFDGVAVPAVGDTLLVAAQAAGLPMEGTCGGQMACATCHVMVEPEWIARLPVASDAEEAMLDLVPDARARSRLACQLRLGPDLDGLAVRLP